MPTFWPVVALFASLCLMTSAIAAAAETSHVAAPPHWIWSQNVKHRIVQFTRGFTVGGSVQKAELKLAADYCSVLLIINDRQAIHVEPYCQTQMVDVTDLVRRGENKVICEARAVEGPSAFALSINLQSADGSVTTVNSDSTWGDVGGDMNIPAADLGPVRPEMWGLGRRSIDIAPSENYEQWQQAKGSTAKNQPKFWTAPGFQIALVHTAQEDEGSWIAAAFDRKGRLTISREDRGLLRMTLSDDRRSVTRVEPIDVDLKECRGLEYDGDVLFANANNSKAMYRLKIDDEGRATDLTKLREFPGNVGHGRNDLALGPNGALYSMHGDSVEAPTTEILDHTSPLRESRRGPAQQEAYLLKTDRDGKQWELICTGLRNPYGVAVNQFGDVFTYDADNEFDMGTPWYRPTRVVQLLSGADYGYRAAGGRWPPRFPDQPDYALPTIDIGRGSPTSAIFGTEAKFPPPYKDALYVLDWTYGRIIAVHLMPHGAGYRAATELFLQGKPLNVTDVAIGPDGAMYLTTGGRKTQSALYRVWMDPKDSPPLNVSSKLGDHEKLAQNFGYRQRSLRDNLERGHGRRIGGPTPESVRRLVEDHDPIIRQAARTAVENQSPDQWLDATYAGFLAFVLQGGSLYDDPRWFTSALLVAQLRDPENLKSLLSLLPTVDAKKLSLSQVFELVRLYDICRETIPDEVAKQRDTVAEQLLKLWPKETERTLRVSPYGDQRVLRRRMAVLLGELQASQVVGPAIDDLLPGPQIDQLTALLALRNLREGWQPEQRRAYFDALNAGVRFVGGEGMPTFLNRLRKDAVASLSEAELKQLADVVEPPKSIETAAPPTPRPAKHKWTLAELQMQFADDEKPGDAKRGAVIFNDALCSRCHRRGLAGPAVGPDLTFVARRFSRADMLASIATPSAAVAENYRNTEVVTEEGKTYVGRMVTEGDFRSEKLLLNVDPLRPANLVEIDKKQIVETRMTTTSPMPEGLLDPFTIDEIRDLLAFLESGQGP